MGSSPTVRRTQIINYIVKQGASTANTLGTLAVFYSVLGIGITKSRGKNDGICGRTMKDEKC